MQPTGSSRRRRPANLRPRNPADDAEVYRRSPAQWFAPAPSSPRHGPAPANPARQRKHLAARQPMRPRSRVSAWSFQNSKLRPREGGLERVGEPNANFTRWIDQIVVRQLAELVELRRRDQNIPPVEQVGHVQGGAPGPVNQCCREIHDLVTR